MDTTPYRRVLLKLSGESFARAGERGISMEEVVHVARQMVQASASGVQLAITPNCAYRPRSAGSTIELCANTCR